MAEILSMRNITKVFQPLMSENLKNSFRRNMMSMCGCRKGALLDASIRMPTIRTTIPTSLSLAALLLLLLS